MFTQYQAWEAHKGGGYRVLLYEHKKGQKVSSSGYTGMIKGQDGSDWENIREWKYFIRNQKPNHKFRQSFTSGENCEPDESRISTRISKQNFLFQMVKLEL